MTLCRPFDYAASRQPRRHEPAGYLDYQSFKPWLRDEFLFRCVYCLSREWWFGTGSASFSVDHLVPRSVMGGDQLECDYENLAYSCMYCNSARGTRYIQNPNEHIFHDHLWVDEQHGRVEGLSDLGERTVSILKLNETHFVERRRRSLLILSLKNELPDHPKIHELFKQEFGFPEDLPDLRSLKPPKGNPSNSQESCYDVLRERGELPEIY